MSARGLGCPLVLEALGRLRESDEGGVVLDIADEHGLSTAYTQLSARLGERRCFSLERMAPLREGVEVIVGVRRDERFGPLALVGLGGVYAELLKRAHGAGSAGREDGGAAPCSRCAARSSSPAAAGGRPSTCAPPRARRRRSRVFAAAHTEIAEVEINPLLVTPEGTLGLDARIVLSPGLIGSPAWLASRLPRAGRRPGGATQR